MRGNKNVKNMLLLTLMLSTIFMAFAAVPAFAAALMKAPIIQDPTIGPGSNLQIDILLKNVVNLYSYKYTLTYNTAVLTAYNAIPVRAGGIGFVNLVSLVIDDAAGTVTIEANRDALTPPGYSNTELFPITTIFFSVDGRGTSTFAMSGILLKDTAGVTIPCAAQPGLFDNTLQGILSVNPAYTFDESLTVGSFFDVYVDIRQVKKLWGFQFIMNFNPGVLAVDSYETLGIFTNELPTEVGAGYISTGGTSYFGDPTGLTTTAPVDIMRITFLVVGAGVTPIYLHDTLMTNVLGIKLIHGSEDGFFANTKNVYVALDTGFLDSHSYVVSATPQALATAQFKATVGFTSARVIFRVLSAGTEVLKITSEDIFMAPGGNTRVDAIIDLTKLAVPGDFDVEFRVQFLDYTGTWVYGLKGSSIGTRTGMVKSFVAVP